jgi:putative tricarboxylic transport membrane protein
MHRRGMIEGGALLAIGLIGVGDALRLILYRNPRSIEDLTGPGRYLLVISALMAVVGLLYLVSQVRQSPPAEATEARNKAARYRVIATVMVLAAYIALIDLIGYFWSTSIFFVLILRVFGFASWPRTLALSATLSLSYYVIFVRLFEMPFPHGMLFA